MTKIASRIAQSLMSVLIGGGIMLSLILKDPRDFRREFRERMLKGLRIVWDKLIKRFKAVQGRVAENLRNLTNLPNEIWISAFRTYWKARKKIPRS